MCPLGASGPHVVCAHNVFTMCPLGIWALVPSVSPEGTQPDRWSLSRSGQEQGWKSDKSIVILILRLAKYRKATYIQGAYQEEQ